MRTVASLVPNMASSAPDVGDVSMADRLAPRLNDARSYGVKPATTTCADLVLKRISGAAAHSGVAFCGAVIAGVSVEDAHPIAHVFFGSALCPAAAVSRRGWSVST